MINETLYQYLGTNGTILSPVHLEDTYYVRKVRLSAGEGKLLTKNGLDKVQAIIVPEEEVQDWYEVLDENK